MKHSKLIAAVGAAILTAGVSMVLAPVASAATPPWEPDPNSIGTIAFYDASGNQITSGSIDDDPMAAYAVGSAPSPNTADNVADFRFAQPNPNAIPALWNPDDLSAFTAYPLTSGPANIVSLSQTHPVATGASTDLTVNNFIGEFPNTDPSGIGCAYAADPSGCTNTAYQNLYQIRMITGHGPQTQVYNDADILVDPTTGTWTQVYGGTPAPDSTSLTMSGPATVNYGGTAKLSTVLKDTTSNAALSGAQVVLKRRANKSKPWSTVGTVTTSSTGAASKSVSLTANTQFEWTYAGDSTHKASTSAVKSVSVAQVIAIHSTKSSVRHGVAFRIWGTVKPSGSGQKVTLQHLVGKTWRSGPTATLKKQKLPNRSTAVGYVFTVKETAKGTYKFRVQKAATSTLAAGTSPTVTVKVT